MQGIGELLAEFYEPASARVLMRTKAKLPCSLEAFWGAERALEDFNVQDLLPLSNQALAEIKGIGPERLKAVQFILGKVRDKIRRMRTVHTLWEWPRATNFIACSCLYAAAWSINRTAAAPSLKNLTVAELLKVPLDQIAKGLNVGPKAMAMLNGFLAQCRFSMPKTSSLS